MSHLTVLALHMAPYGLFHPSELLHPVSFDYRQNFDPVKGRVKYLKRKYQSTKDVQWWPQADGDPGSPSFSDL